MTTINRDINPAILVINPNLPLPINPHSKVENKVNDLFNNKQLKRFQQVSDDNFLSKRFIVHLLGDSFMQNTSYEGWFQSDALLHMIAILSENQISSAVTVVLNDLKKCLEWHSKYLAEISPDDDINDEDEELQNLTGVLLPNDDTDLKASKEVTLTPLMLELKSSIENLAIGEKIVCPGGSLHHSVLYEVKRTNLDFYEFAVYNAGLGATRHWLIVEDNGNLKVQGIYRLTQISKEKITSVKFLNDLHTLQETDSVDFGKTLYEDILEQLEGKKSEVPTDAREYMRIQRSGICSWKVLNAYLRYNLPLIEYKYLKLKARLDVFQKWYDLGHPLDCNTLNKNILNRLVVNKQLSDQLNRTKLEFLREEILALGINKVQKTFNRYYFLLSQEEIKKCETWYAKFTGQSIYNQPTKV